MEVVDYENIEDVALSVSEGWYSGDSTVPWVNSPSIDASTSVVNIPTSDAILEWTLNVVRWRVNTVNFSAVNENTVDWSSGALTMPDGTIYNIAAGSTWIMTAITYIYLDVKVSETTLQLTTNSWTCVWEDKLLVCVAKNQTAPKFAVFQNFGTNTQDVFITADNIAANSITANEMQVNSLSALSADMWHITAGNITLNSQWYIKWWQTWYNTGTWFWMWYDSTSPAWYKFSIWNPTGNYIRFNWDTISLNVPISYSQITGTPTIPVIPNYIKSTYIDSTTIKSPTISAGTITWATIQTATSNQRVVISSDNTIRFYNSSNSSYSFLYWWYNLWLISGACLAVGWKFAISGETTAATIKPRWDNSYDLWATWSNRRRDIYMWWVLKFSHRISFLCGQEAVQWTGVTPNRYLKIYLTDTNWIRKVYRLPLYYTSSDN